MHNLALIVVLAEQRRRQCPCGAVAERPYGLCRKCQDRLAWRRRSNAKRRRSTHRREGIGCRVRRTIRHLFSPISFPSAATPGMEA